MYKLIIADDEKWILRGLKAKISFHDLGIELVAEAENGKQLLDIALSNEVDIIVSDIKMPYMDGLSCFEEIASIKPNIKLVLISGYENFHFAKRALSIDVIGYLLKPVDQIELNQILQKCIKKLQYDEMQNRNLISFQKNVAAIFGDIIKGNMQYTQTAELAQMLAQKYFAAMVFLFSNMHTDFGKLKESIEGTPAESFYSFICLQISNNFVVVAILNDPKQIVMVAGKLLRKSKQLLQCNLSIFVGEIVNNIYDLNRSYESALNTLLNRHLSLSSEVILYNADLADKQIPFPLALENQLIESLDICNKETLSKNLNSFIEYYTKENKSSFKNIKNAGSILMSDLIKFLYLKESENKLIDYVITVAQKILICTNVYELNHLLNSVIDTIYNAFVFSKDDMFSIVNQIAKEICIAPEKDHSLSAFCYKYHISESYFSICFKKIIKVNFQNYITEQRIKKAKNLLSNSGLSIKEIATLTGYENSSYFGKVFKKETGLSPKQFRQNINSGETDEKQNLTD